MSEMLSFAPRGDGEGLAVTGCCEGATHLLVPARVNGVPVTAVAEEAFMGNTALREVIFEAPDEDMILNLLAVDDIGMSAFRGCTSLVRVVIPSDGGVSVGHGAFSGCTALQEATLGNSVCLSACAFYECESLTALSPLLYVGDSALEGCTSLTRVTLVPGASEIGDDAFRGCDLLTEIRFPASMKHIGQDAFRSCPSLSRAEFEAPDGWYWECAYYEGKQPLDLSDPQRNAEVLRTMDFDDGVLWWRREKK